jgi:hypothetical protein
MPAGPSYFQYTVPLIRQEPEEGERIFLKQDVKEWVRRRTRLKMKPRSERQKYPIGTL